MISGTSDAERTFTAIDLFSGSTYTFKVAAVNSNGTGPYSTVTADTTFSGKWYILEG